MTYNCVDAVDVYLDFGHERIDVGRLVIQNRHIWFSYHHSFLNRNLEISPFKLPLGTGVYHCDSDGFEGIHGVFYDSLPDGWGRLLLDRYVTRWGMHPQQLTALDRLSAVGAHGMGALCYAPEWHAALPPKQPVNLYDIEKATQDILGDVSADVFLETLLQLNGSSQGARPKIVVGVSPEKTKIHVNRTYDDDWEPWLIKFRSNQDLVDNGPIEFAYSIMAKLAGLDMPPTHLFHGKYFGVKRFDHDGQNRYHIHTLSGLLQTNYRIPNLDYLDALKATHILTKSTEALAAHFRWAVFNVFAHNRDDHSKNISYKMTAQGKWQLAPAYDLTFSFGPGGEHNMTVLGEGKNLTPKHLLNLGKRLGIHDAESIIAEVRDAVAQWPSIAKDAGVTAASIKLIASYLYIKI